MRPPLVHPLKEATSQSRHAETRSKRRAVFMTHDSFRFSFLALCLLCALVAFAQENSDPGANYLLLPPSWSDRVVFYHTFAHGVQQPEINLLHAEIRGDDLSTADGLLGKGYTNPNSYAKQTPLSLHSPALSVAHPLTVMVWWRLDAAMKDDTCFGLLTLSGPAGYISNFVRGKGEWCGLSEPTFISQLYYFPDITNYNNPWGGNAWTKAGTWHHVAITVANAGEICIYWDGKLRERLQAKGRPFRDGDVTTAKIGCSQFYTPMTLDELIVVDRALSAEEIAGYVQSVQGLCAWGNGR